MDPDSAKESLIAAPLRIGISTRALFDLEHEHDIFQRQGVEAYCTYQRDNEDKLIAKGAAFQLVERLLSLNDNPARPYIEVVLMSKNSPDLSLRAFHSITEYRLNIKLGSFTSGRPLAPFLPAWGIDLFLSNDADDVRAAVEAGTAAARLGAAPAQQHDNGPTDEVRIALDGDAVVFGEESDLIYKNEGLAGFLAHETRNAKLAMGDGPFGAFLRKLSKLRLIHLNDRGVSKLRIGIVTARNAPAHARVIHTLRAWGTPVDEAHFVGPNSKAPILKAMGVHIFFDDQEKHVLGAASFVPSGHVPGPHAPDQLVIPA